MSTFVWIAALMFLPAVALAQSATTQPATQPTTWTADNGDGTFTNPLFYDEFSDPDLIRVGDDYYLTGTTMHAMPGLPILHSRDLVNWTFLTYASDKFDLGPAFRLEEGKDIYGQGIWAPTLRYRDGTFYIFTNINGQTTQRFTAKNPAGPWTRTPMKRGFHDLSVLFDDDGKAYVIWGYKGLRIAQLTDDLLDTVPGTERELIAKDAGMGEGVHFYKIDGKYVITSAWFEGRMRMPCARADKLEGPWEVNPAISTDEDWGLGEGNRLSGKAPPLKINPANTRDGGRMSLHQGGLVQTQRGEWWAWSMMDANSVGRLTGLSPVTWSDGWPYFGLPGNLKRSPRTWTKPNTGFSDPPHAPYERSDDFGGDTLKPIWQWNHVPIDSAWSLTERPGFLRLHAQPAKDFWSARNTLTQRAIGPRSTVTTVLDASGMKPGDVAGLGLLNWPYAGVGVRREADGGASLAYFETLGRPVSLRPFPAGTTRVWLRAECDFLTEVARFSVSTDGKTFETVGRPWEMVFQLRTFQGIRYSLFAFNVAGTPGGVADFDSIDVHEPNPRGLMRPPPAGKSVRFESVNDGPTLRVGGMRAFAVVDLGRQRVGLRVIDGSFVSVAADGTLSLKRVERPADAESFVWSETLNGDVTLTSLVTHCLVRAAGDASKADAVGPRPDRRDGVSLTWKPAD